MTHPLTTTGFLPIAAAMLALSGCYQGLSNGAAQDAPENGLTTGSGESTGGGTGEEEEEIDACRELGTQELRMLTSRQYDNALASLLPDSLATDAISVSSFPQTRVTDNFSTFASANRMNSDDVAALEVTAEAIAALVIEDFEVHAPQLDPCLEDGTSDQSIDACIDGFIDSFVHAAFRRPISEAERTIATRIYQDVRDADSARGGFAAVIQFTLQAPGFLYAIESGGTPTDGELLALSDHELATRLALLFLDGPPDAELLAAAAAGQLRSREQVEQQARRLANSPNLANAMMTFHHEWLRGFALETQERVHPLLTDSSAPALLSELRDYAQWFVEETDGRFATLMTSSEFAPPAELGDIYGITGDSKPRAGLLTTAAAMASLSTESETSLIQRGHFVQKHVLCLDVGNIPEDIDTTELDDASDRPTGRERQEPLLTNPSCAGCHVTFNPLGFPFEKFDWVGAPRDEENGAVIDPSMDLSTVLGPEFGVVQSANELVEVLAGTTIAQNCYARHWFRYSLGRLEDEQGADECSLDEISSAFIQSDGDVRELLVAIAISTPFRFRKAES